MSQAEQLLDSLTDEQIEQYTVNSVDEEHITIDENRIVNVPTRLRRIAVQYDHNVETVTFDCPRYWDERDLSSMHIYINYSLPSGTKGRYLTKDLRVDKTDENIIHFDWVITNEFTYESGGISFLICAVQTDSEGNEEVHWNTEINNQLTVSRGMECSDIIPEAYPDIINDIFTRLDTVIADNDEIIENNETIIQNNADLNTQLNNVLESNTKLTNQAQAAVDSHNELAERITYVSDNMEEYVNVSVAEANADLSEDFYYLKNDVLETGEASGSFINAKDTTLARLQRIKIKGPGEQFTTTGINKLDMTKLTPQTINGVTVTPNKDGSITFNGVMEKAIFIELSNRNVNLPSGEYTWSLRPNQSLPSGDYTLGIRTGDTNVVLGAIGFYESVKKLTLNEDLSNGFFAIYISGSKTFNNFTIYPMLVEGTYTKDTIPPYEPYTGGQASPNPSYPQEHKVIDGYNLYDPIDSCVQNGVTITKNKDNTLTLKGITTTVGSINLMKAPFIPKVNQKYVVRSKVIKGTNPGSLWFYNATDGNSNITIPSTGSKEFSFDSEKELIKFASYLAKDTVVDCTLQISLVTPGNDGDYAPKGSFPVKILGKNLFDFENLINLYKENSYYKNYITIEENSFSLVGNDSNTYIPAIWDNKENIAIVNKKLKPNTKYTLSFESMVDGEGEANVHIIALNPITNKYLPSITHAKTSPITFITNEYSDFVFRFGLMNGNGSTITYSNIQLEEGEPTPYEPYQEQIMYCPIPDGEFFGAISETDTDEFVTEFNEEDGKYHNYLDKNVYEIVLDGSEDDWTYVEAYKYFRTSTYDFGDKKPEKWKNGVQQTCNRFLMNSLWSGSHSFRDNVDVQGEFYPVQDTGYKLAFRNLNFDNVDDFKEDLRKNNVVIRYKLAEPYRIDLGPVDMPISQDSETNVFSTHELSPEMTITYHKNFKKTIENMQVNEKALKQELIDLNTRLSALETSVASIGSEVVE